MKRTVVMIAALFWVAGTVIAQDATTFTEIKRNPATSVKNQQKTGTCWCYSTVSFFESELLRKGKGTYNLSEMYLVKNVYPEKAAKYIYLHGKTTFGEGGQAHDVTNAIRKAGLVPEEAYSGNRYSPGTHNHKELSTALEGLLSSLTENKLKVLSGVWPDAVNGVLDAYLGKTPETFKYKGKKHTPQSFLSDELELDMDEYVELTSYTHKPYYQSFCLEVPDNWSHDLYYNVRLDELIETMEQAIMSGYTLVWDGDVSEKGFSHRNGVAVLQEDELPTPEGRQKNFLSWKSTDDHLMHIVGIAKDEDGTKYYITKNSWSETSNEFGGYLYMSEDYVRMHTVAIMVNRNSIPKTIAEKLF